MKFSEAIYTTELSKFDKSALEVKVYPSDDYPDFRQEMFALTWELVDFKPTHLKI